MKIQRTGGGLIQGLPGCLLIFVTVTAAVSLIRGYDVPMASLLIPALWGLGALLPGWKGDSSPLVLGLTGARLGEGLKLFLLTSAVVFPLYSVLFYLILRFGFPAPAQLVSPGVKVFNWAVYNFAMVAFAEELFFRGYLQGRFENHMKRSFRGAQMAFWAPIFATALLFALAHVAVDLDLSRMPVFFPGLLFGWLRAKTGSLLAPILSHGSANALSMILIRSVS